MKGRGKLDRNEFLANIWEAYESGALLSACAWCGCVCIDGEWIEPPPGALETLDKPVTLSHSVCPKCLETMAASPKGYEELMQRVARLALGRAPD
jgi:hypothetical protein